MLQGALVTLCSHGTVTWVTADTLALQARKPVHCPALEGFGVRRWFDLGASTQTLISGFGRWEVLRNVNNDSSNYSASSASWVWHRAPKRRSLLSVCMRWWGSLSRWGSKSSEAPQVHTVTKWGHRIWTPIWLWTFSSPWSPRLPVHCVRMLHPSFVPLRSRVTQTTQLHPCKAAWPVRSCRRTAADGVTLFSCLGPKCSRLCAMWQGGLLSLVLDTWPPHQRASLVSSVGKESACNRRDPGSIPGSGRSAGEGIGYPLQYSWASLMAQLVNIVHGVAKSRTRLTDFHFHSSPHQLLLGQRSVVTIPWAIECSYHRGETWLHEGI